MDTLKITNLSKTYANGVKALNNISLNIPCGMFGLLGPTGAGKSTLMRTLATLQQPDAGSITLGDLDIINQKDKTRSILGYLPQDFGLYPNTSAITLLNHLAVLKGIIHKKERKDIIEALLHRTNLFRDRKRNLGSFSGGMKQRFGIAQALLANPKLLIVDEPTAGLDPKERNRFHNLLSEVSEDTIVIYSTHLVDDVNEICTNMAIINHGKVVLQGNPTTAIKALEGKVYQKTISKHDLPTYRNHYRVIAEKLLLGNLLIHIISDHDPVNGFQPTTAGLSDVYFAQLFQGN